jgi:hypothetical protein
MPIVNMAAIAMPTRHVRVTHTLRLAKRSIRIAATAVIVQAFFGFKQFQIQIECSSNRLLSLANGFGRTGWL